MRRAFLLAFLVTVIFLPAHGTGRTKITASIFPFYDFTREIVREVADVDLLIGPGVDLHHFEPKPGQLIALRKSDFFVYGGTRVEPWTEKIVKTFEPDGPCLIDVSEGLDLIVPRRGIFDPHIWLDFSFVERIVDNIQENLAKKDKRNAESYKRNAESYKRKVRLLDEKYRRSLSSCRVRTLVHVGHYSFGYLAKRYNLQYVAAYPVSMESEPKPGQLAKVRETVRKIGTKYLFYEEFVNKKLADTISQELKLGLLKLNPGGMVSKKDFESGVTFLKIMEDNLQSLKRGLECKE